MIHKLVDVLIFIPVIPAIPVIATWPLPWERWIPKRVPKSILGPYLLYLSFAAWHFHWPSWMILVGAVMGIFVSAAAVVDALSEPRNASRLKRARDWPVVQVSFVHAQETRDDNDVKIIVTYTYKVQDKRYGGVQSFVFSKGEDAARLKDKCKERTVRVHYRPDKPDESVLDAEGTP